MFYPEQTHKVAITYMGTTYSAYAIYCDNPSTTDFEMRYVEYFMTQSGLFIPSGIPVASFGKGNDDVFRNEEYFESLTATNMEFTVVKFNGEHEKIVVPVSYNSNDRKYYLADPSRLIIVGDYNSMINEEKASFITSDDGKTWRNQDLLVYDRYIKAYDYYAALGLKSVDGTGIPIYIGTQMPEDNACYCQVLCILIIYIARKDNHRMSTKNIEQLSSCNIGKIFYQFSYVFLVSKYFDSCHYNLFFFVIQQKSQHKIYEG